MTSTTTKRETHSLVGLFGFWRQHKFFNLDIIFHTVYRMSQKVECVLENKMVLKQVQAVVKADLTLGPLCW